MLGVEDIPEEAGVIQEVVGPEEHDVTEEPVMNESATEHSEPDQKKIETVKSNTVTKESILEVPEEHDVTEELVATKSTTGDMLGVEEIPEEAVVIQEVVVPEEHDITEDILEEAEVAQESSKNKNLPEPLGQDIAQEEISEILIEEQKPEQKDTHSGEEKAFDGTE